MIVHSPADIALHYRSLRKSHKLSQAAIAEKIGVRQDTVSSFENQPDNTRIETVFRLIAALDMEIHILPKGQNPENQRDWPEKW